MSAKIKELYGFLKNTINERKKALNRDSKNIEPTFNFIKSFIDGILEDTKIKDFSSNTIYRI